jgi:ATP-dependent Clp protease ATP-binding subunit ClpA
VIQEHVKKPMAEELLFGELQKGGVVKVDVDAADPERLDFEIIPGDRLNDTKPKRKPKKTKETVK